MLDKDLLEILCCPACKGDLKLAGEKLICQTSSCGLRFPIKDEIPVMLIDQAEKPVISNK